MISRPIKILIVVSALAGAGFGLTLLHLDNRRLEKAVADRAAKQEQANHLQTDNARLKAIVGAANAPQAATHEAVMQLEQARTELATLEHRAHDRAAELARTHATEAVALATNRDARVGMTRLENIQPAGQSTPTNAFLTALAAALKGDEATLANVATMTPATRAKAEALITRLPEDARTKWTPEKLAALWISQVVTEVTAVQMTGESFEDGQHAVVTFRPYGADKDEHVNVRLTSAGWKVVLPTSAMEKFIRKASGVEEPKG